MTALGRFVRSEPVPAQFEPLVEKLADLSDVDRELVIRAARRRRRSQVALRPVPWDVVHRARAIVALGGDGVEDTNALYDE